MEFLRRKTIGTGGTRELVTSKVRRNEWMKEWTSNPWDLFSGMSEIMKIQCMNGTTLSLWVICLWKQYFLFNITRLF